MNQRSMTLHGQLDELPGLRAFVRDAAAAEGASERATADLVQAVDEAACNVIRHGYRGGPGELRVDAERVGDRLAFTLLDRAPDFDPTRAPQPDLALPPLQRRPGGMGIHLLTTMVDEVHHRARSGGGNELVLARRLDASDQPATAPPDGTGEER